MNRPIIVRRPSNRPAAYCADELVDQILEVGVLLVVVGRIGVGSRQDIRGREDERVLGRLRIERGDGLGGALDRRDVLDAQRQAGGDVDVVQEVDHRQGGILVHRPLGDQHVVRRGHEPFGRVHEVVVRAGRVGQVAGPDERGPGVAAVEVLDVLVALEGADEAVVDERLQVGVDLVAVFVRVVGRFVGDLALLLEHQADHRERVLVGVEQRDLGVELREEELGRRGQVLAGADAVVADAVGERLIRVVVGLIGIPVGALQPLDQVGDRRRDLGRVDRLEPLAVDQAGGHVVGHDHQVPARVEAGIELGLDGGQEVFVAVDVLDVVDLDARLGLEVRQRRRRRAVRVPVHVARPVGPVQRAGDGLAGCRRVGRAGAAARARAAAAHSGSRLRWRSSRRHRRPGRRWRRPRPTPGASCVG